jgi:menaquinone-dependent protoporphyrinogen oxidase
VNILIAYASKSGTTETCVHILEQDFNGQAKSVNLADTEPLLDDYDTILIGGPIRYGHLHSSVKKFMKNHLKELKQKEVALFLCCASIENAEQYFQNNFPDELLEHAAAIECFGGEIRTQALSLTEKFIAKLAMKSYPEDKQPSILKDNIHIFADRVEAIVPI